MRLVYAQLLIIERLFLLPSVGLELSADNSLKKKMEGAGPSGITLRLLINYGITPGDYSYHVSQHGG